MKSEGAGCICNGRKTEKYTNRIPETRLEYSEKNESPIKTKSKVSCIRTKRQFKKANRRSTNTRKTRLTGFSLGCNRDSRTF